MPIRATTLRTLLAAIVLGVTTPELLAAAQRVERPVTAARADQGDPKPHQHVWVKQTRKEWVPPEKKVVQVGVDAKGKPIYETRIVKPGYWKSVTVFACACGATRG